MLLVHNIFNSWKFHPVPLQVVVVVLNFPNVLMVFFPEFNLGKFPFIPSRVVCLFLNVTVSCCVIIVIVTHPLAPIARPPASPQIRTGDESKVGLSCRNANSEESQLLWHERQGLRQLVPVDIRHPAGLHALLFLKERRGAAVCIAHRPREVFSDGAHTPPERPEVEVEGSLCRGFPLPPSF